MSSLNMSIPDETQMHDSKEYDESRHLKNLLEMIPSSLPQHYENIIENSLESFHSEPEDKLEVPNSPFF